MWRKTEGDTGEGMQADSNNDNVVNETDYTVWRQKFGNAGLSSGGGAGSGASTGVPEPSAFALTTVGALFLLRRLRFS